MVIFHSYVSLPESSFTFWWSALKSFKVGREGGSSSLAIAGCEPHQALQGAGKLHRRRGGWSFQAGHLPLLRWIFLGSCEWILMDFARAGNLPAFQLAFLEFPFVAKIALGGKVASSTDPKGL